MYHYSRFCCLRLDGLGAKIMRRTPFCERMSILSNYCTRNIFDALQIDALQEVVKAVNGQCEVYLDGGIRCGNDVFKAIALGARAVFIGRPALWGLACNVS